MSKRILLMMALSSCLTFVVYGADERSTVDSERVQGDAEPIKLSDEEKQKLMDGVRLVATHMYLYLNNPDVREEMVRKMHDSLREKRMLQEREMRENHPVVSVVDRMSYMGQEGVRWLFGMDSQGEAVIPSVRPLRLYQAVHKPFGG